jgi:hypothetical protein
MNKKYTVLVTIGLLFFSFSLNAGRVDKHKEMESEKIKYIKRSGDSWAKAGRIVGELKNPPNDLIIEFYSVSQGKIAYKYKAPGQLNIYMSRFLPPGTYNVTFKASGYDDLTVRSVKLRTHSDCLLNIDFGDRVFTNR